MTTQANEFMHLITFNKLERAQALHLDTLGLIMLDFMHGDALIIDVTDTRLNVEIASRQVVGDALKIETSRIILRDHNEGKRRTTYEGSLKQALLVGIVTNSKGEPVLTFEARKTGAGWQVFGKKFKYVVDTPATLSV